MASCRQGLETPGKEGPLAEVTVPTLHCPLDKTIFPTVVSELPHPHVVAVAPNITYSCYEELGSAIFVTQIPQDCVGGCQWFVAVGFHGSTRAVANPPTRGQDIEMFCQAAAHSWEKASL